MNDEKRKALEAAGWKVGSVDEFLDGDKMSDITDTDLDLLVNQGWIRVDEWNWQSPVGTAIVNTEKALQVAKDERWLTVLAIFGRGDK